MKISLTKWRKKTCTRVNGDLDIAENVFHSIRNKNEAEKNLITLKAVDDDVTIAKSTKTEDKRQENLKINSVLVRPEIEMKANFESSGFVGDQSSARYYSTN